MTQDQIFLKLKGSEIFSSPMNQEEKDWSHKKQFMVC